MGVPTNILDFLDRRHIQYEVLSHQRTLTLSQAAEACHVPMKQIVRAVVLADDQGLLMAILPATYLLDFDSLCAMLDRQLELVPAEKLAKVFGDCEPCSYPPLAPVYNLDVIVDSSIDSLEFVTFEPGVHTSLIKMAQEDFRKSLGDTRTGAIAKPVTCLQTPKDENGNLTHVIEKFTPSKLKKDMDEFYNLPPLPITSTKLLALSTDPRANAAQLGEIIQQDASLAAQVLRYANSSLYGYAGSVKDLKTAIARVLGFDYVLNLSLGFSIGKALKIPQDGPFGLDAFWTHSVYAARLVEQLVTMMPAKRRPNRGTAYLAGLLQNLGRLVLGHTFQPEFFVLNRFVEVNPDMPTCELEHHVLGVTHDQIGSWLMQAWGLPDELIISTRNHHNEDYWDEHSIYSQLVLVANRALATHGIGEMDKEGIPTFSLEMLGLKEVDVLQLTEALFEDTSDLDDLSRRMAA